MRPTSADTRRAIEILTHAIDHITRTAANTYMIGRVPVLSGTDARAAFILSDALRAVEGDR